MWTWNLFCLIVWWPGGKAAMVGKRLFRGNAIWHIKQIPRQLFASGLIGFIARYSNCSASIHQNGVLMSHFGVLRARFSNVSQNTCLKYRFSSDHASRLCGHDLVTPHWCSTAYQPVRSRNANSQSERRLRLPKHGYECPHLKPFACCCKTNLTAGARA